MIVTKRKCIVTGEILPVNQLIRFVYLKDGKVVLEKENKIWGRGAYCSRNLEIIETLFKKRLLNKSFKTNISVETYNELRREVANYVK